MHCQLHRFKNVLEVSSDSKRRVPSSFLYLLLLLLLLLLVSVRNICRVIWDKKPPLSKKSDFFLSRSSTHFKTNINDRVSISTTLQNIQSINTLKQFKGDYTLKILFLTFLARRPRTSGAYRGRFAFCFGGALPSRPINMHGN